MDTRRGVLPQDGVCFEGAARIGWRDRDSGGSHAAAASVATPEAASSIQWVWDSVSGYWYDDVSKFFYDR